MAEIKSTLDLVMERTRHMTQSTAEKETRKRSDFQKAVNGVVQKFIDDILTAAEAGKELEKLKAAFEVQEDAALLRPVLDRIGLDQDNRAALTLLKDVCGAPADGIGATLDDYRAQLKTLQQERAAELLAALKSDYDVSGGAVVPNLAADAVWASRRSALRASFEGRLEEEKRRLG